MLGERFESNNVFVNHMAWKILKRKTRWRREVARRQGKYDGSRWETHKRYDTEDDAKRALEHLEKKINGVGQPFELQFKYYQFKIVKVE
jgi:DNA invertase Pin-like site-specific DNA recombinase